MKPALFLMVLIALSGCANSPHPIADPQNSSISKLRLETDTGGTAYGVEIRVTDFKDVFYPGADGITSSRTEFMIILSKNGVSKKLDGSYGIVAEFEGVRIQVLDCATGTRDWKSFALLEVIRL